MSEVDAQPAVIVQPAKSEDKLEIEKEEAEVVVKDEEKGDGEKEEVKGADGLVEGEVTAEEKTEEDETEEGGGEKKKFSLSKVQIKTPKIIKEIRARSKSREKKKKKEGSEEGGFEAAEEGAGGGEKEDEKDDTDLIDDAKAKVKNAMENINIPKMPKVNKPDFMKKKKKKGKKGKAAKKTDEETKEGDEDKNKEEETVEEDGDKGEESKEESKENKAEDKEDEEKDDSKTGEKTEEKTEEADSEKGAEEGEKEAAEEERKGSLIDNLKSIKTPKMPKMPKFGKKAKDEEEKKEGETEDTKDGVVEEKEGGDEEAIEEEKKSLMVSLKGKMPKMPKFGKKEKAVDGDEPKEEKEKKEGEEAEKGEGEAEEKNDGEKESDKETKETNAEEKTEATEEEGGGDKKGSLIDSLKSMKAPKMPKMPKFGKTKKEEGTDEPELAEEEKNLLAVEEKKSEVDASGEKVESGNEDKEKEAEESGKSSGQSRSSCFLANLRHAASGVPALFKGKDVPKEKDAEAGETDELLEKEEDVKMEEIKLDIEGEEKKNEADGKSQGSEKKDPEKGGEEGEGEEKSKLVRVKELPCRAMTGFWALDQQRRLGLVGVALGILLLLLIIIIAAAVPGGWSNKHRLVEGGQFIEASTGCGVVLGEVEAEDRFLFRGLKYSATVGRWEHSRMPSSLEECGELGVANSSTSCLRKTRDGRIVGEEDCLALDIATTSVTYSKPLPVIVYLPGDDDFLAASTALAASSGAVWVTVSVRQGVLGFLSHPLVAAPTSGNYGLGDLVTALKWIHTNIRHFGGDPDQVTLFGHLQGASLVTVVTAVPKAQGLFHRVWATGGAATFPAPSLSEAGEQWQVVVDSLGCTTKDCLLEKNGEDLIGTVSASKQPWAHDNLPSKGEDSLLPYLVTDTAILTSSPISIWAETPTSIPMVLGGPRQVEANSVNYQFSAWNDTDTVAAIVEGSLGSFNLELPPAAQEQYPNLEGWPRYSAMVSDLRTLCPLEDLANTLRTTNSHVSLYLATESRLGEEGEATGGVADSTVDVAAILGLVEEGSSRFQESVQRKFLAFTKGHIQRLYTGVTVFGAQLSKLTALETCQFWRNTTNALVPSYARTF